MTHNEMLAWIDVNTNSATVTRLRSIRSTLDIFVDVDSFFDYVTTNSFETNDIIVITSGALSQELMPLIECLPKLRAVYIYSPDADKYRDWAEKYDKIGTHRVFREENDLIARLTDDLRPTTSQESVSTGAFNRIVGIEEQNIPTISMFAGTVCNKSTRDLTEEKVVFVWRQLLDDILINMPQLPTARDDMLRACQSDSVNSAKDQRDIENFRQTYTSSNAINWYTREIFLYRLLNRALRTENIDIIFQFRMIIIDLCHQLAQLFKSTSYATSTLTVYRGQRMTINEITKLSNNIGGLISMNSFVSTTLNKAKTNNFLKESKQSGQEQTVAVLFELILDVEVARNTNKPFVDISKHSHYQGEAEVLLTMGTVFRIDKIQEQSFDLWYVTATMCTPFDDPQLKSLFDYSKDEICSRHRITYSTYGKFLAFMSHCESAIKYLSKLLDPQSVRLQLNNIEQATIHNDLAYAYRESCQYSKALEHYQIALDLKQNRVPVDEIDLAITYSDMGWLLMNINQLEKARDLHEKALAIRNRDFANNRADTAMSFNCLGLVCAHMSELDLAKKYLQRALAIRQDCLPPQHPYIAMSYSSLGSYFSYIGDTNEELKMEEQALSIYKSSVPPTHHILKSSYYGVGMLYLQQKQWQKAIEHLKESVNFDNKNYQDIRASRLDKLAQAYLGLGNKQCALECYQKALTIAKNMNNNTLITKFTKMIEQINT